MFVCVCVDVFNLSHTEGFDLVKEAKPVQSAAAALMWCMKIITKEPLIF